MGIHCANEDTERPAYLVNGGVLAEVIKAPVKTHTH